MSMAMKAQSVQRNEQQVSLFSPITMGAMELPHRVAMAPLTRNRADDNLAPQELNVKYYEQRSSAAVIISEATQISQQGQGYPNTPGIYSEAQLQGWREVTNAVHRAGGKIILQLWHVGRISHPDFQPNGATPVAPSAVKPAGKASTPTGEQEYLTPRALDLKEIPGIIAQYKQAALNAQEVGFDGVEVHSANGYLLDQFLRDGTNKRDDKYGGSITNRCRLTLEVINAVLEVWSADRVGIRLSPSGTMNDMQDGDPKALYSHLLKQLESLGLAYVHIIEPMDTDIKHGATPVTVSDLRPFYPGIIMANGEYDKAKAAAAIACGSADMVSFGRDFLANPDLPERLRQEAELNEPNPKTFYGGGAEGYTDYPAMDS